MTAKNLLTLQISNEYINQKHYESVCFFQAYQTDNPLERRAFAELIVYVTDVNDHPPDMSMSSYDVTVQEHLANGTVVARVSGTDRDIVSGFLTNNILKS